MTAWLVDAVLARMLADDEMEAVIAAAEACHDGFIKDRVDVGVLEGRRIAVGVDRRSGARRVFTACMLGEGVRYASSHDRTYQTMGANGPEGPRRIDFETSLSVEGAVPPRSVVDALVGRPATALIDHPALRVDGLVATASYVNTRDGVPYGFSVGLPRIDVEVGTGLRVSPGPS